MALDLTHPAGSTSCHHLYQTMWSLYDYCFWKHGSLVKHLIPRLSGEQTSIANFCFLYLQGTQWCVEGQGGEREQWIPSPEHTILFTCVFIVVCRDSAKSQIIWCMQDFMTQSRSIISWDEGWGTELFLSTNTLFWGRKYHLLFPSFCILRLSCPSYTWMC